jgi:hypothetical protein
MWRLGCSVLFALVLSPQFIMLAVGWPRGLGLKGRDDSASSFDDDDEDLPERQLQAIPGDLFARMSGRQSGPVNPPRRGMMRMMMMMMRMRMMIRTTAPAMTKTSGGMTAAP